MKEKLYTQTQYADKLGISKQLLRYRIGAGIVKVRFKVIGGFKFIVSK